jgi:hypothetical protein
VFIAFRLLKNGKWKNKNAEGASSLQPSCITIDGRL